MRPDGLRWKVWLIDPAGPGVAEDRAALRGYFEGLPAAWRPPVVALCDDGLGCTVDKVGAALDEIAAFDGLRVVWIGGHSRLNRAGKPALYTDDLAAADRISLSLGDLWERLAEAAERGPLVAWVDVCEAAKPKRAEWPAQLAALAASRPGQVAEGRDGAGGWFTQALLGALAAGYRTPAALAEGLKLAARRANQGRQTVWEHVGAAVAGRALGPELCPRNAERLRAGQVLGYRYRLGEILGDGAFSVVWAAEDLQRREEVALKVLHSDWARSADRVERFERGAREMAGFDHPHIVKLRDRGGVSGGHHYFTMERVHGPDLHRAVLEGQVGPEQAVRIALEIGDALAYAHRQRTTHRDVKPGNILLDPAGKAYLTDFDLVRAEDTHNASQHSVGLGTFIYAAPEMLKASKRATKKVDVFGLAMTTVFMLHGAELDDEALFETRDFVAGLACAEALKAVLLAGLARKPEARLELGAWLARLRALPVVEGAPVAPVVPERVAPAPRPGQVIHPKTAERPGLVYIPGGTRRLGPRDVTLSPFLLADTPVTQAQYQAVTGKNPSHFTGAADSPERPVEQVSWHDAVAYCNALSNREGLRRAYAGEALVPDADGYRLPTEAEWEYACQAGTTTEYWSGDAEADLARVGWYKVNSGGRTHRVGEKQAPSPWGLHDMHGNVWEWCHDWLAPLPAASQVDPTGPARGGRRVSRGGSWGNPARTARSASRDWRPPGYRDQSLGFRLARGQLAPGAEPQSRAEPGAPRGRSPRAGGAGG